MKIYLVDSDFYVGYDYHIERSIIEASGNELILETCRNEQDVIARCKDADVLMTVLVRLTAEVLDACPQVKGLIRYGIGVDAIDIPAATARGIPVCNFTDYCIAEVSAHAFAMILALSRNLPVFTRNVRQGLWRNGPDVLPMHRASSRTLGLAGFGNIARALCGYAKAMGYHVIAFDPYLPAEIFAENGAVQVSFDELLTQSDILSLHTPMTPETHHMINRETLAKMKDGIILVNTARGPLICEEALIDALRSGKVAAAGLDVVEFETITVRDHPYASMDNVILSPHAGYDSVEAAEEIHEKAAQTAVALCAGKMPGNAINRRQLAR